MQQLMLGRENLNRALPEPDSPYIEDEPDFINPPDQEPSHFPDRGNDIEPDQAPAVDVDPPDQAPVLSDDQKLERLMEQWRAG